MTNPSWDCFELRLQIPHQFSSFFARTFCCPRVGLLLKIRFHGFFRFRRPISRRWKNYYRPSDALFFINADISNRIKRCSTANLHPFAAILTINRTATLRYLPCNHFIESVFFSPVRYERTVHRATHRVFIDIYLGPKGSGHKKSRNRRS